MKDAVNTILYFAMFALVAFFCSNVLAINFDNKNEIFNIYEVKKKEDVVVENNRIIEYYENYHEEVEILFEEKKAEEKKKAEELKAKEEEEKRIQEQKTLEEANRARQVQINSETVNLSNKQEIAEFAKQFVGNPYVAGGYSLTSGTDCSGFVKLIYEHFGISVPRGSYDQAVYGIAVSADNIEVGDIVSYSFDGVSPGHSALYIGDGLVIHASTPSLGIIISELYSMPLYGIRRII